MAIRSALHLILHQMVALTWRRVGISIIIKDNTTDGMQGQKIFMKVSQSSGHELRKATSIPVERQENFGIALRMSV